jgi:hypothetical protein
MKKYIWLLVGVLLVIGPGVIMYLKSDDIHIECVVKEPGVTKDREEVFHYVISRSQFVSVSTAKAEDHSTVVYRNLKGTQFVSYPGVCDRGG